MKSAWKILLAALTLLLGGLLGVLLLTDFKWWKMPLFVICCYVAGHIIYSLMRLVDKHFLSK